MNSNKLTRLFIVLILASFLIIAATQRFDTIIAKKIVITGSGGLELGDNSGSFDLNGKELTLDADDDSSFTADTDDQLDLELGGQDEYVFTASVLDLGEGTLTRIDLDADGDTSIRSSADDRVDFELGGSDTFSMTSASLFLNGKSVAIDSDQDTTMVASVDDIITYTLGTTTGRIDVKTGNLKVGNGTPTFTQDGEDTYLEGTVELGTDVVLTQQSIFTVTASSEITPTGFYQQIGSADLAQTVNDVAAPTDDTVGKLLILHNMNATFPITIDGTGATVECKADVELGPKDTLTLIWNGADWNCLSSYDNS